MRMFKVGGMRFLRIGRLQVSWCICRAEKPAKRKTAKVTWRERVRQINAAYNLGLDRGRRDALELVRIKTNAPSLQIANH